MKESTSNIEFGCLFSMVNAIIDMYTICTHIRMITFVDRKWEYILLCFYCMLRRIFQFCVIEEPGKQQSRYSWRNIISLCFTYHVTFGVGNASQVIWRVPFWLSRTLMSVSDCVIFSGATKYRYMSVCIVIQNNWSLGYIVCFFRKIIQKYCW